MKVDRQKAIAESLRLLDEVGLDALSTRRLAARLGVQQPALYWHFRDKQALLDAMNEMLLRGLRAPQVMAAQEDWRGCLHLYATSFRDALRAVRDGARVHAGSRAAAEDLPSHEARLDALTKAGLSLAEALGALVTIARFVVGFVLEEQAEADHPPAFGAIDPAALPLLAASASLYAQSSHDARFEHGLGLILDGVACQRKRA